MSRILRRPMFRGGRVDARGTGIASGLGYQSGGRVGFGTGGSPPLSQWVLGGGTTGGQTVSGAADKVSKWSKAKDVFKSPKFSERGLLEAIKKYGPKALNWGKTGIAGLATRFPLATTAAGLYGASTPTPVDEKYGITRMDNLFPMFGDTEETMMKKFKRNEEEASNPNNPWRYDEGVTGIPRKEHPLYDPEKSSWFPWSEGAAEEVEVTGIEGPPGGGDKEMFYDAPDPDDEDPIIDLLNKFNKSDTKEEKLAKMKENKEMLEEMYGTGRADDASAMLLNFAGKALKPEATVKSAFGEFFEEEGKRPSERKKYKDAATQGAIQMYLTGEKSFNDTMKALELFKAQKTIESDMKDASKTIDNLLSAYAGTQKDRTDEGVMQSSYNELYKKIDPSIFVGKFPEKESDLIVGKIYYKDDPRDKRNKLIYIIEEGGTWRQINTILK